MTRRWAVTLLLAVTACSSHSPAPAARSAVPSPSASPSSPASSEPTATPSPDPDTTPNPEPSYRALPVSAALHGFAPSSVSFVSTSTGWFLGTSCGLERCGVLLQTRDAGRTFVWRQAPPVRVAAVRFANLSEGWAFGNGSFDNGTEPGLWRTHDGGRTWRLVLDRPVPSLEIGNGTVWAVVLDKSGTAPQLWRGDVRANTLRYAAQVPNRAGTVVVGHGTAYVVAQSLAGPIATTLWAVTSAGARQRRNPCASAEARALQVAVGRAEHLAAICSGEPSAGSQLKRAYASTDDGRTWRRLPDPPEGGYTGVFGGSVAATTTSTFMTGGRNGINKEAGSGPWRSVLLDEDGSGFSFVGFTDDSQGVALGQQAAWMTADGGEHWRRLRFS